MLFMKNINLEQFALAVTRWAERWFPDAYIFAALAVILFLLVIPIVIYNVRQLKLAEEVR